MVCSRLSRGPLTRDIFLSFHVFNMMASMLYQSYTMYGEWLTIVAQTLLMVSAPIQTTL